MALNIAANTLSLGLERTARVLGVPVLDLIPESKLRELLCARFGVRALQFRDQALGFSKDARRTGPRQDDFGREFSQACLQPEQ